MNRRLILISIVLALGLTACSQPAAESSPSAVPTPSPAPTAAPTPRPTAAVTVSVAPVVTAAPATPEPTPEAVTPAPTAETQPTVPPTPTVPDGSPVPTAEPTPAQSPEPTPDATPAATPEPLPSEPVLPPEVTPEPARPTDEAVLEAYRTAREAYNWFDLCTLEGHQDEKRELDGMLYARVADERFPNMDSFRSYLKTLFSDEVVDGLLPIGGQQYVEIDGQLYTSEGGRGTDITKGAVTLSVVWPPEGEVMACTVRAEVELLDEETLSTVIGTEVHEFPYQKVGDKWVFTHFESIM